jgi:exosortase H (IPTLxxWG-CTERM-specific)
MRRFLVSFLALVVVLFAIELTQPVQRIPVEPWTGLLARASAWLITLFDPGVHAYGRVLQSGRNGFAISIESGCNGVEAALILVAAILAFRAPWRHKLAGIALGLVAVQVLNVVRVISLFYLGQWNRAAFEWAHLYAWQALIMLDVVIVWLLWLRALPPVDAAPPRDAAPAG